MKAGGRLFIGGAGFFAVIGSLYWFTSYEPAGTTLLALGLPATLLIGIYLRGQQRRLGLAPQDQPGGSLEDALGNVVAVPAPSIWPVAVAAAAGTMAAGMVLGIWLLLPGVILLAISLIGHAITGRAYSPGDH